MSSTDLRTELQRSSLMSGTERTWVPQTTSVSWRRVIRRGWYMTDSPRHVPGQDGVPDNPERPRPGAAWTTSRSGGRDTRPASATNCTSTSPRSDGPAGSFHPKVTTHTTAGATVPFRWVSTTGRPTTPRSRASCTRWGLIRMCSCRVVYRTSSTPSVCCTLMTKRTLYWSSMMRWWPPAAAVTECSLDGIGQDDWCPEPTGSPSEAQSCNPKTLIMLSHVVAKNKHLNHLYWLSKNLYTPPPNGVWWSPATVRNVQLQYRCYSVIIWRY